MAQCPNCPSKSYSEKAKVCDSCGYKDIPTTNLDAATLVYCDECGCTYMNRCTTGHTTTKVDLNKTGEK